MTQHTYINGINIDETNPQAVALKAALMRRNDLWSDRISSEPVTGSDPRNPSIGVAGSPEEIALWVNKHHRGPRHER